MTAQQGTIISKAHAHLAVARPMFAQTDDPERQPGKAAALLPFPVSLQLLLVQRPDCFHTWSSLPSTNFVDQGSSDPGPVRDGDGTAIACSHGVLSDFPMCCLTGHMMR
jgi:hypothetical protein